MEKSEKKLYTPALVLGICSIVAAFLFAIAGWVCGIIGIVLAAMKLKDESLNSMPGLICSIIGLALSLFSSIIGAAIMASMY